MPTRGIPAILEIATLDGSPLPKSVSNDVAHAGYDVRPDIAPPDGYTHVIASAGKTYAIRGVLSRGMSG